MAWAHRILQPKHLLKTFRHGSTLLWGELAEGFYETAFVDRPHLVQRGVAFDAID